MQKDTSKTGDVFPFKTVLSLKYLIEFWEKMGHERECADVGFIDWLNVQLANAPELREPITDIGVIEKHKPLMDALMTAVFPSASWDSDLTCAIRPFRFEIFYATPSFREKMMDASGAFITNLNVGSQPFQVGKLVHAYLGVLRKFYGFDLSFEYPIITTRFDPTAGIERFYKLRFDARFTDIYALKPVKPLTNEERKRLLDNLTNVDVLAEIIPTSNFEFHGFVTINAVDVTDQELMSALKVDLIEREALMTMERFHGLEQKIQSLLRRRDVRIGLAALPPKNMQLGYGRKIGYSFILDEKCKFSCETFEDSVYDKAFENKEVIIVDDLATHESPTNVEKGILSLGIHNIGVAPLTYQGEMVGILELGSPTPNAITPLSFMKLNEVLSLFAMAIKRSSDELNNDVQAVIKQKCTAIHPSVEWRFRVAAMNLLQKDQGDAYGKMEPIVFENVYPLYGLSDVRGSSTQRNASIQADLMEHLQMAQDVVLFARTAKHLPILDELNHRITKMMAMIRQGVNSGDEVGILDFLQKDVESLFPHFEEFGKGTRERIDAYKASMDSQMGFLYRTRKEFEESITLINETVSSYIDDEQVAAQEMFPHYFEKYKTDGVDHGMYIGASLVDDRKFDNLFLKNLRLWQLIMMCGVVRKTKELKPQLKIPLDTAHLILVQDQPLSIRFRFDEKKFDVDGAYNIRYEIMKKRIDKATLKGSEERLTQPGKIAIVYSQLREANEYKRYIDYLQSTDHLLKEVEYLDLEDLQGIQGLKALRVAVNTSASSDDNIAMTRVEKAVQSIEHLAN